MEGLNKMVKTVNVKGWIRGFDVSRAGRESLEMTHLQYADDTLILCEEEQLKILRVILVLFEGGEVGALPTTYLGMPLGAKSKSTGIWNNVIEKCEKKLARWKSQYLSFGGRLTLINSVLDALPTYMMSLFPIPAGIIKRLDSIRRNFLWQGNWNKERKGYHLVKWKSLLVGKRYGGLGIKNLEIHSKALRMKDYGNYRIALETILKSQRHFMDYAWKDYRSTSELGGSRFAGKDIDRWRIVPVHSNETVFIIDVLDSI
ncbi:uncharacterized protein LOC132038129 [Lycium ferocissimum]|uniref:uncharacterized protein LOC132038129 n=1 Tax=Lycium ferocissimum TaxID=112874 RepID=UPI002815BE4B|nr:uncharacterized protein LOC132038129 [Lycium ferocissimum]